jgi:hypothetical protein
VIVFIGDGSFNYNPVLAALSACQEHRMPMLIVLLNKCRLALPPKRLSAEVSPPSGRAMWPCPTCGSN